MMPIKEKGYTHWDGELQKRKLPWLPMTWTGIKITFRKKFFKFTFFMAMIPALAFSAGIYISERLQDFQFMTNDMEVLNFLQVSPQYFKNYLTSSFLLFMTIVIMVFCGAGLISEDLKHNALQLYFSRPIRKMDYLFGKASVIAFFLLILTLIPGWLFFGMKLLFAGNFDFLRQYPWIPLSVLGYSLFLTFFFALYTLFLSSLSQNRRYVSLILFGLYLVSDIIFGIFYGIFHHPYLSLLSIKVNLQQVGAAFFNVQPAYKVPWIYSFLIITVFGLLAGMVINKRVSGVEVVK
jgi:ABC-type transport system involved in multi-copper enzyme maturation permease subunit